METLEHGATNLWITDSLIIDYHLPFMRGTSAKGGILQVSAQQLNAILGITRESMEIGKCHCTIVLLIFIFKCCMEFCSTADLETGTPLVGLTCTQRQDPSCMKQAHQALPWGWIGCQRVTFLNTKTEPPRTGNKSSAPPNTNLNIDHNTNPSMVPFY